MVNLNRMTLDSLWFIVLAIVLEAADQKSVVEGLSRERMSVWIFDVE